MVNVDRMVGGLCQLVQDADTAPGLGGSTEYGQTEVFFAYHLRAGEGEQDTSWLDLFESDGVQFAVPCKALRNTFLCLAKAGGSRMMRS